MGHALCTGNFVQILLEVCRHRWHDWHALHITGNSLRRSLDNVVTAERVDDWLGRVSGQLGGSVLDRDLTSQILTLQFRALLAQTDARRSTLTDDVV